MKRVVVFLPLLVSSLLAAVMVMVLMQQNAPVKSTRAVALIKKPVPANPIPPKAWREDVIVVNFFASWCVPCLAEQPALLDLQKRGVAVYGVNYKDKPADKRAFLARAGNPYRTVYDDPRGMRAIDWGVSGVPETFVIDRKGYIRYHHKGPLMADDIDAVIMPVMGKVSP